MASLVSLPPEILQQIIFLCWDEPAPAPTATKSIQRKSFGQLSLVCHRFVPVVQRQLFRHVYVSSVPWPGRARFERFKDVLRSSPAIRSYVESVELSWFTDRWDVSEMVNGDLLLYLDALRNLVLETDSPGHSKVLDFMYLEVNPMPRLRSLQLYGARMTFEAAVRLVRKPGLLSLRLGRCEGYEVDRDRLLEKPGDYKFSSLQSLDTTDSVLLDIELRQLLSCCGNLTTLVCNLPRHLPEEEGDRPLLWQYRTGVPASRHRLPYCLEPVSVSLTHLTTKTVREDSRELQAPDLTSLVSLRSLCIDAACLWSSQISSKDDERVTFYKRLPQSLEELEVHFERGKSTMGVFWATDQAEAMARSTLLLRADEPARYEWIANLAKNKPNRLPYLASVRLLESFSSKCTDDWYAGDSTFVEDVPWEPPSELDFLFQGKAVSLLVILRLRKELELILAPR